MAEGGDDIMTLPTLGRVLELGQLWDARRYQHLAGLSLWGSKVIEDNQQVQNASETSFSYERSETERQNTFNLKAEAALSVGVGIFTLEGSASYLKDSKSTQHEIIVSATCRVVSRIRRIRQEDLAKIEYSRGLDLSDATHFVAQVTEGGLAAMTFRLAVNSKEEEERISGELSLGIKTWIKIEGSASVDLENFERTHGSNLQIKFFGDYALDANPTSLQAALAEAGSFPIRLKGVTKTLECTLLPLRLVDSAALRICRSLAGALMEEARSALTALDAEALKLKALRASPVFKSYKGLCAQVEHFSNELSKRQVTFRDRLAKLLPELKGLANEDRDTEVSQLIVQAATYCKVTGDFIRFQDEQLMAISALVRNELVEGAQFEDYVGQQLPLRPKAPAFLVDLAVIDSVDEEHPLSLALDKTFKKGGGPKAHKWWNDVRVTDALTRAKARKTQNDFAGIAATCLLGIRPSTDCAADSGEEEEEAPELLFAHSGTAWLPWDPPEMPTGLHVSAPSARSLLARWNDSAGATEYLVTCSRGSDTSSTAILPVTVKKCEVLLSGLEPHTTYEVQVRAISGVHGASEACAPKQQRTPREPSLAHQLVEAHKTDPSLGYYGPDGRFVASLVEKFKRVDPQSQATTVRCVDVIPGFKREHPFGDMEKALVIILTGETGAGKSTHLNSVFNFLMGVAMDDDLRLVMVDESTTHSGTQSVTQYVTMYMLRYLPGMPVGQSLVLVDSPGYGDTRGLDADAFVTRAFRATFAELTHLNCVAFIVMSNVQRLTQKGKMVMGQMLSLFHKEVKDNIVPVCSFADFGEPLCLKGLQEDKVPFTVYVKVQNSPFARTATGMRAAAGKANAGALDEMRLHWELAESGVRTFLKTAAELRPRRLQKSTGILQKRQDMHDRLTCLRLHLAETTGQIGNLLSNLDSLATFLGNVPKETVKVDKIITKKIDTKPGQFVTLCQLCNRTCHLECGIPNNADKRGCSAMGPDGYCTICPKKCFWDMHHNADFYWSTSTITEDVVPEALIEAWAGKGGTAEGAILRALKEIRAQQTEVTTVLKEMMTLQADLESESLRHSPGVLLAYVDSLIEGQRQAGANEAMLKSLHNAKSTLQLCVQSQRQKVLEEAKSKVMGMILQELERRSKMASKARAAQEQAPSDFYDTVLAQISDKELLKKVPAKLSTSWFGKHPPFSQSLTNIGMLLKVLLQEGVK